MTDNEKQILEILRELKPYEKIEITKDASGKPDFFIVKREQKIFFNSLTSKNVV